MDPDHLLQSSQNDPSFEYFQTSHFQKSSTCLRRRNIFQSWQFLKHLPTFGLESSLQSTLSYLLTNQISVWEHIQTWLAYRWHGTSSQPTLYYSMAHLDRQRSVFYEIYFRLLLSH